MTWPDPTQSYFVVLDVPTAVDADRLTAAYRALVRRWHPDRFATADAATQQEALAAAALISDAYRTLQDPFARAEYLLRQERGVRIEDGKGLQKPPQALFARVLELQEALMEYQEALDDDDDSTIARLHPSLREARSEFAAAYDNLKSRLAELFAHFDGGEREAALDGIAEIVGTRGYLRRVLTNLDCVVGDQAGATVVRTP
jgi:molecular chaperone HscB